MWKKSKDQVLKEVMDLNTSNIVKDEGFVICIQTSLGECYLGERDGVMTKLHSAKIYHDMPYAQSELRDLIFKYKNTEISFFNDEKKLSIKPITIQIN